MTEMKKRSYSQVLRIISTARRVKGKERVVAGDDKSSKVGEEFADSVEEVC